MGLKQFYDDPYIQWIRGAIFSFVFVGVYGINLPFVQKWLKDLGFNYTMIGVIIAIAMICGALASPFFANLTDEIGRPKILLVILPLIGSLSFFIISQTAYIWLDILGYVIAFICFISLMPLADNMSVHILKRRGWAYGPMRAMGSAGFIFVVFYIAPKFTDNISEIFVYALCIGLLSISLIALMLPDIRVEKRPHQKINPIFKSLIFISFLAINFLLVHSHAVWMVNGTNYWSDALHFSEEQIAYIWNIGVFGEVVVMLILGVLLLRYNPIWSMLFATICAVIRWSIFAFTENFWVILFTNSLHGFTFGLFQIAAITWVNRISPPGFSAVGISLYAATSALATATGSLYAGYLYQHFSSKAFVFDVFYAVLSLILVIFLLNLDKKSKVATLV